MSSSENTSDPSHGSPVDLSMSEDEICHLALRFQRGDMEAVRLLLRAHLSLVLSVAREHLRVPVIPLTKLISAGNDGLMHAIKTCPQVKEGTLADHIRHEIDSFISQGQAKAFDGFVVSANTDLPLIHPGTFFRPVQVTILGLALP
jgi:hypothetical protein